ncbi:ADP-ribosylglycohydrolase family protein [Agarivorans gilvus]|uniref:Hydrolase n=1 Tax=Agarivorans gilvus TaxID=680279 RepID=A0ABQ1I245_9ALTE|nr:ADP-ribosylglycohydrolase family protein [Agarivorans gilvus]GGB05430.1 hydrolase [Agarivorans gilvus]
MLGGIIGDVAGSLLEGGKLRSYNFSSATLFSAKAKPTDDSVLLAATAAAMLDDSDDFAEYYRNFAEAHPNAGYGPGFSAWLKGESKEYQSFGNGAAARAGVLGYLEDENEVLALARRSAEVSHLHEEGVNGALAMAWCVWALRQQLSEQEICQELYRRWNYYVDREHSHNLVALSKGWNFDCSAINTVPLSIYIALFHGNNFEAGLRAVHYLGGDTDTIGCMVGLLKAQIQAVSQEWAKLTKQNLWRNAYQLLLVLQRFEQRFEVQGCLPF